MSFYHLPSFRRISKNSKTILALLIIFGLGIVFVKLKSSAEFNIVGAAHSSSSVENNVEFRAPNRHSTGADSGRETRENYYINQPEGFDGDGVSLKCKEHTSYAQLQKRYLKC